jgi:unsaturated chondroitin disaccharide hydrolase
MTTTLTLPTLAQLERRVSRMLAQLGPRSPHATANGVYDDMPLDWWTSGFWPGLLWVMYDLTHHTPFRLAALGWDEQIERQFSRESDMHHDVGFQFLPTAVLNYAITGDAEARRRGLRAANFLAGRFNPAGRFIRAWNGDLHGRAIIDSAMNLSLLFWASRESGDPRFRHVALAHADTLLAHFLRADGSVRHMVDFDPESGGYLKHHGGQGYSPESAWSRGQAWALYGFTNIYRHSGAERFRAAAERVANFYLHALPPAQVPPWDFRAPDASVAPRDTAAAAIVASGLLDLAAHASTPAASERFRAAAESMLGALTCDYGTWDAPQEQGLLRGGTGNLPAGRQVNVSLIYGDYFYVEALAKLMGWARRVF